MGRRQPWGLEQWDDFPKEPSLKRLFQKDQVCVSHLVMSSAAAEPTALLFLRLEKVALDRPAVTRWLCYHVSCS